MWFFQGFIETTRAVFAYPVAEPSLQQIDVLCAMAQKCLMWLFRLSPREHILLCPNLLGTLKASLIHWLLLKHLWQLTMKLCATSVLLVAEFI